MEFFITCPKGLEPLLADELAELGISGSRQTVAGVSCSADVEQAYRLCLWSRLANRVLLQVGQGAVESAEQLYQVAQEIDWQSHIPPTATLSVAFTGKSRAINHSHFAALKVKDAIVDQLRERSGHRPDIDRDNADIRVRAHLYRGQLTVYLDLSGESLHRRGYRMQGGAAPLKENLAAAILRRCQWPSISADYPVLFDPMCGSGTLLIEGLLMAADIAPGLSRAAFGFERWGQHQPALWQRLLEEAQERRTQGLANLSVRAVGRDQDETILAVARENAERAGVADWLELASAPLARLVCPSPNQPGLLLTNPPYGERLGDESALMFLYRQLGDALKQDFAGWKAAVFTGNPELSQAIGLKADKSYRLFNGPIDSRLLCYTLYVKERPAVLPIAAADQTALDSAAQMITNRLKKNLKNYQRWLKQNAIQCYRLYDADIPEFAVAIDRYGEWVQVQEYAAPASIDKVKAFERLQTVLAVIPEVLQVDPAKVVLKQRKRQSGTEQYEKQASVGRFFEVQEHGCRLRVNLHDYLDTGLFLDHRPVRRRIQASAAGKDVLNLFCYTASASVHAAVGGATTTTSVDMSATYLQWAMKNLALNGFSNDQHRFIQSDCITWLKKQRRPAFDLIFMDPPTFSNSKRMQDVLDVQRDHVQLIRLAMRLLRPDGVLLFSNNYRKFKLDYAQLSGFAVRDITAETIDPDFKRNSRIHCCFEIRWPARE